MKQSESFYLNSFSPEVLLDFITLNPEGFRAFRAIELWLGQRKLLPTQEMYLLEVHKDCFE